MPLHWEIRHDEHLVVVRTEGAVRFADIAEYFDALRVGEAIGYRKLADGREGYSDLSEQELISYLGAVAGYLRLAPPGPQALVLTEASSRAHQPLLRMIFVNRERDLRMFADVDEALAWLMRQPVPSPASRSPTA